MEVHVHRNLKLLQLAAGRSRRGRRSRRRPRPSLSSRSRCRSTTSATTRFGSVEFSVRNRRRAAPDELRAASPSTASRVREDSSRTSSGSTCRCPFGHVLQIVQAPVEVNHVPLAGSRAMSFRARNPRIVGPPFVRNAMDVGLPFRAGRGLRACSRLRSSRRSGAREAGSGTSTIGCSEGLGLRRTAGRAGFAASWAWRRVRLGCAASSLR